MYTKFISKNIQEKLKAKERAFSSSKPISKKDDGSLDLKSMASRTTFARMCSNKVEVPKLIAW